MQFGICSYETKKSEEIPYFLLIKEVLIMALNDTFKILPKNKIYLEADLSSFLSNKEYLAKECKEHLSKKRMPFLLRLKLTLIRKLVNFGS